MKNPLAFLLATALIQSAALALETDAIYAFDNATVQPGGPRTGTNGKNFFNVEGSGYTNFSSFGVLDFEIDPVALSGSAFIESVSAITFILTQANAAFTTDGGVAFYLSTDTGEDIQPGSSPLVFESLDVPGGLASQLATTYFLGTGTFLEIGNGVEEFYPLSLTGLDPAIKPYLANLLTNGGVLRVVIVATEADTAATWAGYSHFSYSGPAMILEYSIIPEPATGGLLLGGLGVMLWGLRKRRQA